MDASELVAATSAAISARGSAYYFDPATLARGKEVGLDGFRLYFLGRGGVLGNVGWPLVYSAFAYFKPSLVEKIWESGRERADPAQTAQLYADACADFGRAHLGGLGGLDAFCEAGETVVRSAEPAALALFAGLGALPRAEDPPARAMQLVTLLREHRGGVHLVAVLSTGLSPTVAHYLRRPTEFTSFGYGEDEIPAVTDEDRARWAAAEALTDRLVEPAYAALDNSARGAFADGVAAIDAALAVTG
jgi:hypothetical protein